MLQFLKIHIGTLLAANTDHSDKCKTLFTVIQFSVGLNIFIGCLPMEAMALHCFSTLQIFRCYFVCYSYYLFIFAPCCSAAALLQQLSDTDCTSRNRDAQSDPKHSFRTRNDQHAARFTHFQLLFNTFSCRKSFARLSHGPWEKRERRSDYRERRVGAR